MPVYSVEVNMAKLPAIECPRCSEKVESKEFTPTSKDRAHHANSYKSCLRKCEVCGFGFSNANTDRTEDLTIIYRDPFWNVPSSIAEGYEFTLKHALNVINRRSKKVKFTSSKSEDHVTWTIFRWLQMQGAIRSTIAKIGVEIAYPPIAEPTLLLWGAPVPKEDRLAKGIRNQLENILEDIGEGSTRRSEPDIILDFGAAGLVIIEVKVGSPNDTKKRDYAGWNKYITSTGAFLDSEKAKSCGLYELVRNWRIAWEMAEGRPMGLVNLGPTNLFDEACNDSIRNFCESIRQSPTRQFLKVTWQKFLETISDQPEWFKSYVQDRGLA
jgi:hypothetical protein